MTQGKRYLDSDSLLVFSGPICKFIRQHIPLRHATCYASRILCSSTAHKYFFVGVYGGRKRGGNLGDASGGYHALLPDVET